MTLADGEPPARWHYPRPGLALLPQALRPVFRELIRHPPLGDGTRATAASELTASIWSHRSQADCEIIVSALSARLTLTWKRLRKRRTLLERLRLPVLSGSGCLEALPLSALVLKQLRRHQLWDPKRLFATSVGALLDLPGWGSRRLLELLVVLEAAADPGSSTACAAPTSSTEDVRVLGSNTDLAQLTALEGLLQDTDIPTTDVRFGPLIRQLHTGASSLRKALRQLKAGVCGFPHPHQDPWAGIRQQLAEIERLYRTLQSSTLEEDLQGIAPTLLGNPRAQRCLAHRLGWADGQVHTLQEVGDAEGLTRERVRQFEAKAQRGLAERTVFAPRFLAALECARSQAPCSQADLAQALCTQGIAQHPWTASALLQTAAFFGVPHGLTVQYLGTAEYLASDPANASLGDLVLSRAQARSRCQGAVSTQELAFELSEHFKRWVSEKEVRAIASALAEARWLDEPRGWLWFGEHPHHRVLNATRKMLSITPRLPLDDLYEGLLRNYRMDADPICPKAIVLALCRQVSWIHVRQVSHLTPRIPLNYREELAEVECAMVQLLQEAGGALDHYTFRKRCRQRGISPSTFGVYEGNSPLFRRIAPGVWGLRGVFPSPALLLRLSKRNERRQRRLAARMAFQRLPAESRNEASAQNLRLFKLSEASFRNYILTVSGIAVPIGTRFAVRLQDEEIGQIEMRAKGRLKGLLTLLKAHGVRPGDQYLASFDVTSRQVSFSRMASASEGDFTAAVLSGANG